MRPITSVALEGIQRADADMLAAATRTAQSTATAGGLDTGQLAADTVTIMSAKAQLRACVAVARTADEVTRSLLDLVG
ncbi:MAG: flagellar hook protein FlgE [Deltaproteobacteria bacterium]|nr:flagellar hook protein FlgE [Deltaproteobacteria bacterium]